VPSDATLAIIFGKDYAVPTGTPVLGGQAATLIIRQGTVNDRPIVSAYYLLNPPTGAQNLVTGVTEGFSDTYEHGVSFYKGNDGTSPIEDSAGSEDGTDLTGMTYSSGGMMVGAAGGSYSDPTVTDNSQTELYHEASHGFAAAQRADVGAFYFTGTDLNALAVTIKPAAGGIGITAGVGALTATGPVPILDKGVYPGAGVLTAAGVTPTLVQRTPRYAYPSADSSDGPWKASDAGPDLYAMLDETSASDTDYIYADALGTAKIKLYPVTDPGSSSGHTMYYRIWSPVAGNAKVRLVQGTTTIKEWTHTGLPTSATTYSQSLSGGEADSITNYDDLYLEVEAT